MGTKSGGREEEEGMSDPRSPQKGFYIVGRRGLVAGGP
jgi:hypothetical protein